MDEWTETYALHDAAHEHVGADDLAILLVVAFNRHDFNFAAEARRRLNGQRPPYVESIKIVA